MRRRLACLLVLFASVGHGQEKPELAIENPGYDFGLVPQASKIAHEFWCKSAGDDTVTIEDIKTGCGCIGVLPEKATLPPGDSVAITLFWDTRTSVGEIIRTSYLFTNVSADPYQVTMRADCRAASEVIDSNLSIYSRQFVFAGPRSSQAAVTVRNLSEIDYSVSLVEASTEAFDVVLPDSIPAGASRTLIVGTDPEYWSGDIAGSVTIEFVGGTKTPRRITLPVSRDDLRKKMFMTTNMKRSRTTDISLGEQQ